MQGSQELTWEESSGLWLMGVANLSLQFQLQEVPLLNRLVRNCFVERIDAGGSKAYNLSSKQPVTFRGNLFFYFFNTLTSRIQLTESVPQVVSTPPSFITRQAGYRFLGNLHPHVKRNA